MTAQPSRSLRRALVAVLCGAPLVAASPSNAVNDQEPCTRSWIETFKSCRLQSIADFWRDRAVCTNLPPREAAKCRQETLIDLRTVLSVCSAQREARSEVCARLGGGIYSVDVDPNDFPSNGGNPIIDNPYLPLVPGTTRVYQKLTDEGLERIEVTATHETRDVLGVTCRVVRDTVTLEGELVEDTFDWYAQDNAGNVWYFGELSMNFENGELTDLDGSWESGRDDAQPGIIMLANPMPGDFYRQEYLILEAEDVGGVIAVNETVTIGLGTYTGCLQTEDATPIEPGALEFKYYAPGVGLVLETKPGETERLELIAVLTGG